MLINCLNISIFLMEDRFKSPQQQECSGLLNWRHDLHFSIIINNESEAVEKHAEAVWIPLQWSTSCCWRIWGGSCPESRLYRARVRWPEHLNAQLWTSRSSVHFLTRILRPRLLLDWRLALINTPTPPQPRSQIELVPTPNLCATTINFFS